MLLIITTPQPGPTLKLAQPPGLLGPVTIIIPCPRCKATRTRRVRHQAPAIKRELHQQTDRLQPSQNPVQVRAFVSAQAKRTPYQVCRSTGGPAPRPSLATKILRRGSQGFSSAPAWLRWRHAPWARYLPVLYPYLCAVGVTVGGPFLFSLLRLTDRGECFGVPVLTLIIACPPVRPWLLACF